MNWHIPAKTFLVGEYAAIAGGAAIILTTSPCFQLTLTDYAEQTIHPESPAGLWLSQSNITQAIDWHDPYQGIGGLGASSAQFIGVYLADCENQGIEPDCDSLLTAYYQNAWQGRGLKPSGYDVLAQTQHGCVYINRQKNLMQNFDWPFADLGFLLLHSGHKLATHHHLQAINPDYPVERLSAISEQAKLAFETANSNLLVQAVNDYQHELARSGLTAHHTLEIVKQMKGADNVSAIKGCGAMGADVLLLLVPQTALLNKINALQNDGWKVLASSHNLHTQPPLIKKYRKKYLNFSTDKL
ncbi:hypothetical protein ACFORL_02915 [Legionella dresdenensis]|uniref:Mevalonate kinase n=1 Tax=Legionella dresdenensis TaxID=450200 RepID=A0ABV8CDI6_9GAMM